MALKLFNTMGRELQEFKPICKGKAGFYGCGPTVYNYAHIGNLRAYVFLDVLDKTLQFLGYEVNHVMNVTDIGHLSGDSDDGEDKMLKTAKEKGQSVLDIAKFYTDAFFSDIEKLNIRKPDVVCKATEHVNEMIELIKKIEANGHTYMAGGNLYYDVTTFADYGKLAMLNLDDLKAGAGKRDIVVVDENKRNPHDFVLWFTKSKYENHALVWDSPWGKGYPGWHIECSAMSMKYLGENFDIHTGGIDHIPIHHTNEIAQSEGATGKKWVNYWLHNEFLVIAKEKNEEGKESQAKMSKSSGNFLTLQKLIDNGYAPLDYRFLLLGGHYRSQITFSWPAMEGAKNSRKALTQRISKILEKTNFLNNLDKINSQKITQDKAIAELEKFKCCLEDDLSTPKALSILQTSIKNPDISDEEKILLINEMDKVLSLSLIDEAKKFLQENQNQLQEQESNPEIEKLIQERSEAKKQKNYARSDEIRDQLKAKGIILIDTPQGTTWKYE